MGCIRLGTSDKPKPSWCTHCDSDDLPDDHWMWAKDSRKSGGGRWGCRPKARAANRKYAAKRAQDPARHKAYKASLRVHYLSRTVWAKYQAYRGSDRRKGFQAQTIPWLLAEAVMASSCTYCQIPNSGGLDRVDNTIGHSYENVVPACGNCNLTLIDMPMELKMELSPALISARRKGLLDTWQHPKLRSSAPRAN